MTLSMFLSAIALILAIIAIIWGGTSYKRFTSHVVELRDKIPAKDTAQARAMQLADELAPYIKVDEEKNELVIKVFKED